MKKKEIIRIQIFLTKVIACAAVVASTCALITLLWSMEVEPCWVKVSLCSFVGICGATVLGIILKIKILSSRSKGTDASSNGVITPDQAE